LLLGSKQVSGVPFVEFRITYLENKSSTVAVHLLSSGTDVVKSGRCEPTYWLHSVTHRETNVVFVTAKRTQNTILKISRTSHAADGRKQLVLGVDCGGLFEGANEMIGDAANWRRLRTEQRRNGFEPHFDANLTPSNAAG